MAYFVKKNLDKQQVLFKYRDKMLHFIKKKNPLNFVQKYHKDNRFHQRIVQSNANFM